MIPPEMLEQISRMTIAQGLAMMPGFHPKNLVPDAEIAPVEYKAIKLEIEESNDELIRKRANLSSNQVDFRKCLRYGATIIRNLDERYEAASLSEKQLIIGRCFRKNWFMKINHFEPKR